MMQISVFGAGAWGTALAIHFARHGHKVLLYTRRADEAATLNTERVNRRYLDGFVLPETLTVSADLNEAAATELAIIATPVSGLRPTLAALRQAKGAQVPVLAACKGFEAVSGLLPHEVIQDELPGLEHFGLLSGPSFAQELAQGLPCAVCLASPAQEWIGALSGSLNTPVMRLYAQTDVIGVGVGGAVKNVMAIATGIADGLNCGLNARAALMTRGLAEIGRLAQALGANAATLMGLAGMGDLILTCTGALSRNRTVGLKLATGKPLSEILSELGHVAEGVNTVREVVVQARRLEVDMPITETVADLFDNRFGVNDAVHQLMTREPKFER